PAALCHEVPSSARCQPGSFGLIVNSGDVIVGRLLSEEMLGADPRQLPTPARVLTFLDSPVLAEVVRFALSHGQFIVRAVADEPQTIAMLEEWQPHLAIID